MNDNYKISHILALLLILIVIILALVSGLNTISQPQPINTPPRAAESSDVHNLFFRAVDVNERGSSNAISLIPGRDFELVIMLSRATGLEEGKKYKFHLKFNYNANVFELKKPYNSKLNESEKINTDIVRSDQVFDEIVLDKVEEKETDTDSLKGTDTRMIDIEGNFSSTNYSSLDDQDISEEKKDKLVIIGLPKFQVKSDVVFNEPNRHLLAWDRDDTKIERVDSTLGVGFINPNNELKLEMVDKDVKDFKTGSEVIPQQGSDITTPLGVLKVTGVPGQTTQQERVGSTTVNLSIKFQGILRKPDSQYNSMPVKITLSGGASASPIPPQTGTFTADDAGVWTGSVSFPAVGTGSNYRILIKGPKHLQKRICDTNPSESYPGSYTCTDGKISVQSGSNTFDFSKVYLLAGDLPEQNGVQNGFTNSYDTSLIRNNLNNTDPNILKFADLNLDGIVNTQDFSLAIAALEFRSDEQ